ncbi:MAG: YfhO family protein, partial [Anaerolineaceae bacterium]|nr:YfhO family protein [Anaerolineaceae bacterium]
NLSDLISSEEINGEPTQINFTMPSVNAIVVDYTSDKPGWIVVRQNWFPGWHAIIDGGEDYSIEKVDYLFQGVLVPAGKHSIVFTYKPKSFSIGLLLSIISVILILISQVSYSFYRKFRKNKLSFTYSG